jgi:hypothetical protein
MYFFLNYAQQISIEQQQSQSSCVKKMTENNTNYV